MIYCVPCAIEFEHEERYKLHVLSVHSPQKAKQKKKKSKHGKIALKAKQYVNLPNLFTKKLCLKFKFCPRNIPIYCDFSTLFSMFFKLSIKSLSTQIN